MIGIKLEIVLREIEALVIENKGRKPYYSDESLKAVVGLFADVVMDKMHDLQLMEYMGIKESALMAEKCGKEIRKLVKTFTGKDTVEMFCKKK